LPAQQHRHAWAEANPTANREKGQIFNAMNANPAHRLRLA